MNQNLENWGEKIGTKPIPVLSSTIAKLHTLCADEKSEIYQLVDVIEEDFRVETIPHVYGKDKQAVINRLLDKYYRSSNQFTYSETLSREKAGRKDDNVLLGAITNAKLITPWLEIIERCGTPLSGIWTLPLISKDLLKVMKVKADSVLLVSQQVSSSRSDSYLPI